MAARKPLHELLEEVQEPFILKNYIADRRCQIKTPPPNTHLQVKKQKTVSVTSGLYGNFCRNACFFSADLKKSPLFEFAKSPAKSPCRNAIFLHVPAKTAALLLEAALRIQKNSASAKVSKNQNKTGLFGSILRRLKQRSCARKREIEGKMSVKDILRWDSFVGRRNVTPKNENLPRKTDKTSNFEICNGRTSSARWSESNEEKSFDIETSSSGSLSDDDFEFASSERNDKTLAPFEYDFNQSPFRFVLQRSPSPGRRSPEFSSPAASPRPHKKQEKENLDDVKSLAQYKGEEDEEQFSPVSVLDPPFQDDEDRRDDYFEEGKEGFDVECSYEVVQRAKQQLLHKLRRFEKLAELDPLELENRILEHEHDVEQIDELEEDEESESGDEFIFEVLRRTHHFNEQKIPKDMERLVSDLVTEEEQEQSCFVDREAMAKRVCQRFESWKDVEFNTIDMMVEEDLKHDGWKSLKEQIGETASEVVLALFGSLVEELAEELLDSK